MSRGSERPTGNPKKPGGVSTSDQKEISGKSHTMTKSPEVKAGNKRNESQNDSGGPWQRLVNEDSIAAADEINKSENNLRERVKAPFPPMSLERLDEDFFHYADAAYGIMQNSRLSVKQNELASRWLHKLLTETYVDVESKKNRNIFLSNLLLQVADGDLVSPLHKAPPSGPLPNASVAFKLSAAPDPKRVDKAQDIMLDPKDYMHRSTDGRTYIATKSFDNDTGACAFIGVSVGGDEPVWIKPSGEETNVPEREDLAVTQIEARGDNAIFRDFQPGNSASVILGRRKSHIERQGLRDYYQTVLAKIEEAKNDESLPYDGPKDHLLRKLVQKIRCEIKSQGASDEECRYQLLVLALERKIQCLLQKAVERDDEIERIAAQENLMDNEPKLVDLSAMMAFDPEDDIWKAAVSGEPNSGVINALNDSYPSCIVSTLLMLLERQRQITIDQEKKTHEQLVAAMKAELLSNVREEVIKYKVAERDYNKILKALKQVERQNIETVNAQTSYQGTDTTDHSKLLSMKKQVVDAQRKLDAARQAAMDIDSKTDELTCKIADVQRRNKEASDMLRQDAMRWSKIICQMKADLQAQQAEISRLDQMM